MFSLKNISLQERVDFAKNLSVMLKSGIAINDAFASLGEQSNSLRFRGILLRVQSDIENGTSLSEAFEKEVHVFGRIFVSMIKAGEQSGTLQGNLQFLAFWLSRSADLRREVSGATLYPKLVFGASMLLGGGLAVFILPMLVPIFEGLNVELPWITRALLAMAMFVQSYWLWSIAAILLCIVIFVYLNSIRPVRSFFHLIYIKMPFIGGLLRHYELALISELFTSLLKSGLSLNESIDIVSKAATNIHYQNALVGIKIHTEKGTALSASMNTFSSLFPRLFINIIKVGEESGTLVESFGYLAEFYSKEVSAQAKKLPTIIEPLLLIFIAMLVGFVALAIILPIYELTGSIS
jgi:type IV pilus assembly protein PilC